MGNHNSNLACAGFSLVEMAVVIVLMGMLMTFGIRLAGSFQDKGAYAASRERQALVREALASYLGRNGRLPCPAAPTAGTDGLESRIEGAAPALAACTYAPGIVPYQTLGLARDQVIDGWGRFLLYEVSHAGQPGCGASWVYARRLPDTAGGVLTYHDGQPGCLALRDNVQGDDDPANDALRSGLVAVLVSNGPNGFGGLGGRGQMVAYAADDLAASRELDNILESPPKTAHRYHSEPARVDGFDDLVVAITADDLLVPLKRDGSIVAVAQLERQYLYSLFSVSRAGTDCVLHVAAGAALDAALPASTVTVALAPPYGAALTVSSSAYDCAGPFVAAP